MLRLSILFMLMLSAITYAHEGHDQVGTATHRGSAAVLHDGDYIDFSLNFEAACYQNQHDPRARVIENVNGFVQWLGQARSAYAGVIDYRVGLINVSRRDNPYIGGPGEGCVNKYDAQQSVTVTLNRSEGEAFLDSEIIQGFFNDLQIAISPLNFTDDSETDAYVTTKISSVQKGVWEETSELLRINAKLKAKAKATRDFLAILREDYQGWWHLHSVDFGSRNYSDVLPVAIAEGGQGGGYADLSVLRLEPIRFEVEGNFIFHFEVRDNYLP